MIGGLTGLALALSSSVARADAVTDWNEVAVVATKGFNGITGSGVALDSNLASRIEAIAAKAVFDAINAVDHFSARSYFYSGNVVGSAAAAAAAAAHDVLMAQLPDPSTDPNIDQRWAQTRSWLDARLLSDVYALGLSFEDGGFAAGRSAAAAALAARKLDGAKPVTSYGADLGPSTNPGIGIWRQSNASAPAINQMTGAPSGFDASGAVIQPRASIDLNWRDVMPLSLSLRDKVRLVAQVPFSPAVGSPEYLKEIEFVRRLGQDTAPPSARSDDQTAQALFYKQDAEIFVFEAARIAAQARGLSLDQNAALFALLTATVADARIAAFDSKYQQRFWRPITALNANPDGSVTNNHQAWRPLAATPSHPSNTAGHSTTGAAGFEILRAFFGDTIRPDRLAVTLTTLPWLVGTNSGTGRVTTRSVTTFSQAQLENGASRLYLGVHYGYDNLQGQLLGLAVAEAIVLGTNDPAASGIKLRRSRASLSEIERTLLARPDLYGLFGLDTRSGAQKKCDDDRDASREGRNRGADDERDR